MKTRLINAAIFLVLYLAFLAWYDGWGMDPFTAEEVDTLVGKEVAKGANPELLKNLRRFLKDDDGEEFFMLNLNRYEYAENEDQQGQQGKRRSPVPARRSWFRPLRTRRRREN